MVDDDPCAVPLAKKICARCPVTQPCLREALQVADRHGPDQAAGVWGGLTQQERASLHGLGLAPRTCPGCAARFVPINRRIDRCSLCAPRARVRYEDYREQITKLIGSGLSCEDAARRLQLRSKAAVASACRRWKVVILTPARQGRRPVMECGTLAAKSRHRKNGQSWQDCACKHVRWKRGTPREEESRTR